MNNRGTTSSLNDQDSAKSDLDAFDDNKSTKSRVSRQTRAKLCDKYSNNAYSIRNGYLGITANERSNLNGSMNVNPFLYKPKPLGNPTKSSNVVDRDIKRLKRSEHRDPPVKLKITATVEASFKFTDKFERLHQQSGNNKNRATRRRDVDIEVEGQNDKIRNLGIKALIPVSKMNPKRRSGMLVRNVSLGSARKIVEFKIYKNDRTYIKNLELFDHLLQPNAVDNDVDTSKSEIERAVIKMRNELVFTLQPPEDSKSKPRRHKSVIINKVCRGVILARDSNVV